MGAKSSDWYQWDTEKNTFITAVKKKGVDAPAELDSVVTAFCKNNRMSFLTFHPSPLGLSFKLKKREPGGQSSEGTLSMEVLLREDLRQALKLEWFSAGRRDREERYTPECSPAQSAWPRGWA